MDACVLDGAELQGALEATEHAILEASDDGVLGSSKRLRLADTARKISAAMQEEADSGHAAPSSPDQKEPLGSQPVKTPENNSKLHDLTMSQINQRLQELQNPARSFRETRITGAQAFLKPMGPF